MKKLSLLVLLLSLLCCALLLSACDQGPCADGHTAVTDAAVAATCTDTGLTEGSHCSVCNAVIVAQESVPAHGHSVGEWVTQIAPSCTQDGSRYNTCTVCKQTVQVEVVKADGHTFGEWTELSAATCTAQGKKSRTCSVCEKVEEAAVDVLPHQHGTPIVDLLPSCTTNGSQHFVCGICYQISKVEILEAPGHSLGSYTQTAAPTCTNTGMEQADCAVCFQTVTQVIPATGHTEGEWVTDFAATCLSGGSRHRSCSVCTAILSVELLPALTHEWSWTTCREASCTQTGEEKGTCSGCTTVQYRTVPLADHTPGEWIVDIQPTCLSAGVRHRNCTVCNGVAGAEAIAKLSAHTPATVWSTLRAPTATAAGENALLCTTCGAPTQTVATTLNGLAVAQGQPVEKTVSGYRIVYEAGGKTDTFLQSELTALQSALRTATKTSSGFVLYEDGESTVAIKEILVGTTSRKESVAAQSELSGNGFVIRAESGKIVILGSNRLFTILGVRHFINNYLKGTPVSGKISVHEFVDAKGLTSHAIATATGSSYKFVLDDAVDNDPQHKYTNDTYTENQQGYANDSRDIPAHLMDELISAVAGHNGIAAANLTRILDTNVNFVNNYELLLGEVNRVETLAFRQKLDAHEYGICITHNKVIITAHNDLGLQKAFDKFLELFQYAMTYTDGRLPEGYEYIGAMTDRGWNLSFPRPEGEGITLHGSQHNNDKSIQLLYTGSGVSVNAYLTYCTKLESEGYTIVTKSDNPGNTGSYFRTYKKGAHVLYVAYNAYAYESVYASEDRSADHVLTNTVNDETVYYPIEGYQKCIRIVSAPTTDDAHLPPSKLLNKQPYTKVCESSITTTRIIGGIGMGYIIQLEDGRFILIDGGSTDSNYDNVPILYNTLLALYAKSHNGASPSDSNPIHIAAWYITHSHGDHYGVMSKFLETYAPTSIIKLEYLVGNFPESSSIYSVKGDTSVMGEGRIDTLHTYFVKTDGTLKNSHGDFTYVKVHTGHTLYFANVKMEVLMTYEDVYPRRIDNSNDTNTVTKLTFSSANSTNSTTWMVLGDATLYQSRWLCAMWGGNSYNTSTNLYDNSYMKADMVQLAHHGNIGSEIAIYKTIQPTVVWFPNYSSTYNSYTQDSDTNWADTVDRYVINTMQTVQYIVVSGWADGSNAYTKGNYQNYHDSITLQFNQGVPDYTSFWGIKYTLNKTPEASKIAFNSGSGTRVTDSPVIKKK